LPAELEARISIRVFVTIRVIDGSLVTLHMSASGTHSRSCDSSLTV
jgi:hypothetical protein